jgi:plasmid maintenance system killer protein
MFNRNSSGVVGRPIKSGDDDLCMDRLMTDDATTDQDLHVPPSNHHSDR